ncbi:MAG: hypothetical protein Kow0047_24900 [Anaerolineae bacterium]
MDARNLSRPIAWRVCEGGVSRMGETPQDQMRNGASRLVAHGWLTPKLGICVASIVGVILA